MVEPGRVTKFPTRPTEDRVVEFLVSIIHAKSLRIKSVSSHCLSTYQRRAHVDTVDSWDSFGTQITTL